MGPHPQDLRPHTVDRASHGLLLQQLKEREGASTGPPTIMKQLSKYQLHANGVVAAMAVRSILKHLEDNEVTDWTATYPDLEEELQNIILDAIDQTIGQ